MYMERLSHKTFWQVFFLRKPIESETKLYSTMKNLQSETVEK